MRKNAEIPISTAPVYGMSRPATSRLRYITSAAYRLSTQTQKRIEPSSALQSEMTVKNIGVLRLPTCATYDTLKSCVTSAVTIAATATLVRPKTVYTVPLTRACSACSLRRAAKAAPMTQNSATPSATASAS